MRCSRASGPADVEWLHQLSDTYTHRWIRRGTFSPISMQAKLNELNSAFQPLMGTNTVRTILLDAPTIADFYNAVSKEMPQIIHIVAENGFDLESNNEVLRFPATGAGAISNSPARLGKVPAGNRRASFCFGGFQHSGDCAGAGKICSCRCRNSRRVWQSRRCDVCGHFLSCFATDRTG